MCSCNNLPDNTFVLAQTTVILVKALIYAAMICSDGGGGLFFTSRLHVPLDLFGEKHPFAIVRC